MTSVRLPEDMERELERWCALTRRPKSFYIKEALAQYFKRGRARMALRRSSPKKAGKILPRKGKKGKGPLDDLVGKYSLGEGIVTNAALEHNDIYDYSLPWDRPSDDEFPMIP